MTLAELLTKINGHQHNVDYCLYCQNELTKGEQDGTS